MYILYKPNLVSMYVQHQGLARHIAEDSGHLAAVRCLFSSGAGLRVASSLVGAYAQRGGNPWTPWFEMLHFKYADILHICCI